MDLAPLRHNFEIRDFQTGRALQQRQHVQDMQVEVLDQNPITVQLQGAVAARQDTYFPRVGLLWINERIHADGECDCGGYNCAHIAALAIHYLVQIQQGHIAHPDPEESLFNWLADLHLPEPFLPHQVVLVLSHGDDGLTLTAMVQKRKQNGAWGKRIQTLTDDLLEACTLSDLDWQILALLNEHLRLQFDRRNSMLLEGRRGALLLKLASQHPRVVWKSLEQPAEFQPAKTLAWHWQILADGCRLESDLPHHWQLTNTTPVYAYDTAKQSVIALNEDRSYAQLTAMRQAPVVPKQNLSKLRQMLPPQLQGIDIPEDRPIEYKTDSKFTAQLIITRQHPVAPGHYIAQLQANYDELTVSINGEQQSRIEFDDRVIELARDRQSEQQAIDTLLSLGLHASEFDGQVIFWHQPPQKPDDQSFWQQFIAQQLPALAEQGWDTLLDPSAKHFALSQAEQLHWQLEEDDNGWFDLSVSVQHDSDHFQLLPLLNHLIRQPELLAQPYIEWQQDGATITVDSQVLKPMVNTLRELAQQGKVIKLRRNQLPLLNELSQGSHWQGRDRVQTLQALLTNTTEPVVSSQLQATLRDYQLEGLQWLQRLEAAGFNALLADDMGLGKTLQVIAHISANSLRERPSLVIAPTSLLGNWREELSKFVPHLRVATWHGSERSRVDINELDVLITTYAMARIDGDTLQQQPWHYMVVDEAQQVKNHRSQAAQALRNFTGEQIIALSGTPVENHLKELWSIFDLLEPGLLGGQRQFSQFFSKPINAGETEAWQALQQRVRPFMLRRTKAEVVQSLPAKTEMVRYVSLEGEQAELYETIRLSMQDEVSKILAQQSGSGQLRLLDALLKLRQVCCHPQLIDMDSAQRVQDSAKLDYLLDMLAKLLEDGRKVLVFSQFAKMLAVVADRLEQAGTSYSLLTGSTKDRDGQINRFKQGGADVFLISLKAGGVGLNLTEADTVIHYDPWWNPASETQASDRAHRIGQDKPVFVYKLIVENSVEDRILRLQARKRQLADQLYKDTGPILESQQLEHLLLPLTDV